MHESITYRGTVYPWHCDHMGHMNVMWYVGKFDEALWNLLAQLGLTRAWLQQHGRGMAAVEQTIRYTRELVAGDVVLVRSRVVELRPRVMRIQQAMQDAVVGHPVASMEVTALHLDTALRRAVPFPDDLAERIARGPADITAAAAAAKIG